MIDWQFSDTVADLREKVSTLRSMLRDAHRREDAMVSKIILQSTNSAGDGKDVMGGIVANNRLTEYATSDKC